MELTWKVNTIMGATAFLLTYFFSITNNIWQTSILRAIFGFLFFFLLGYILRLVLSQMNVKKIENNSNPIHEHFTEDVLEQEQEELLGEINKEDRLFQQIPLHSLHQGEDRSS